MIDRDLAALKEVETKRLKEAVSRFPRLFPKDYRFAKNTKEFENWRTHFSSSKED